MALTEGQKIYLITLIDKRKSEIKDDETLSKGVRDTVLANLHKIQREILKEQKD